MRFVLGLALLVLPATVRQATELSIELVGNAGVVLSDSATSLLIDLPYESGAFGYMRYDLSALRPAGEVLSVITHEHRDHFARELFVERADWRIMGPRSVTLGLPTRRVLTGDSATVGAFQIVALGTPHTDGHRSYRIHWRGRVLFFSGDTEDAAAVPADRVDIAFVSPWLQCALTEASRTAAPDRTVLYHLNPDGSDRICGSAEQLRQGTKFTIRAAGP
jgi:glyoxylase-like metal-dependent hydrolase (beta-lactamase superfamily II)